MASTMKPLAKTDWKKVVQIVEDVVMTCQGEVYERQDSLRGQFYRSLM